MFGLLRRLRFNSNHSGRLSSLFILMSLGCAAPSSPSQAPDAKSQHRQASDEQAGPTQTSEPRAEAKSSAPAQNAAEPAQTPKAVDPFPGAQFPPAPIAPMHPRSAQPGDGEWSAVPEAGEVGGEPIMYRTSLRPHTVQRFAYVNIVAIDLSRTEIHLVAGTSEPISSALTSSERTGLIPEAHHGALAAVFNGGFMTRHGQHGMGLGEVELLPPNPELCTVALLEGSKRVRIGSWSNIQADKSTFRAWRQSPWCLIENGKAHPNLTGYQSRRYGLSAEGKLEIRRSAVGLSPDGRTLYYAVGEDQTPALLASTMQALGVEHAAQLDINWSYTRFLWFSAPNGQLEVSSSLLPKMKFRKNGYVSRPEPRDFFYITRAAP